MSQRRLAKIVLAGILGFLLIDQTLVASENADVPWQTNYLVAHQQRLHHRLPMLIFVTTDDCHFCHKMLATTLSDPQIAQHIRTRFVPTKIDAKVQAKLTQQFGVRVFPTTFIVSPNNRILDRIEGYLSVEEFRQRIAPTTVATKINRIPQE